MGVQPASWLVFLVVAVAETSADSCPDGAGSCVVGQDDDALLQLDQRRSFAEAAHGKENVGAVFSPVFQGAGTITHWSFSDATVVGSSCGYANFKALDSPAATSPYIRRNAYCAVNDTLYAGGGGCGSCYRITFTPPHGTASSDIIQVVSSGSHPEEFRCHTLAFSNITGHLTVDRPHYRVTYELVDCDVNEKSGAVATVLDGDSEWYTQVIFSNFNRSVTGATLAIGDRVYPMARVNGAIWSAKPFGASGNASFSVALSSGAIVKMDRCFDKWPVPSGAHCQWPPKD